MDGQRRWIANWALVALAAGAMVSLAGGCQRSPFNDDLARTPYERYMALRGLDRPLTVSDEFGVERKALRERLSPLEGQ